MESVSHVFKLLGVVAALQFGWAQPAHADEQFCQPAQGGCTSCSSEHCDSVTCGGQSCACCTIVPGQVAECVGNGC